MKQWVEAGLSNRNSIWWNIPEKLKGTYIEVLDLETEKYSNYASISATAKAIRCSSTSIRSVIKLFKEKGINRPIKKRYLIKIV